MIMVCRIFFYIEWLKKDGVLKLEYGNMRPHIRQGTYHADG